MVLTIGCLSEDRAAGRLVTGSNQWMAATDRGGQAAAIADSAPTTSRAVTIVLA
jgi:hypothetical protein